MSSYENKMKKYEEHINGLITVVTANESAIKTNKDKIN